VKHQLETFTFHIQTVLAMGTFLTSIYVACLCAYVAPTGRLRRWGLCRWWLLFRRGPAWPEASIATERGYEERGIGLRTEDQPLLGQPVGASNPAS
jgi:hypothetical protein